MRNHQKELEAEVEAKTNDLRLASERIRSASLETIFRLASAAEYKDEDTGGHIVRMAHYAAALAARMGLDRATVENIRAVSPRMPVILMTATPTDASDSASATFGVAACLTKPFSKEAILQAVANAAQANVPSK